MRRSLLCALRRAGSFFFASSSERFEMRAVQVMAPGRAEFIEMPKPTLKPGHALIRTRRLSLCGSDTRMLHYAPVDHYPFPPATTGHEMVGLVEAIDAPGSGVKVGDMALVLVDGHLAMSEYYLAPVDKVLCAAA
jgi:D-arabinose 1-dehydrogenase-like Zn-dependent alcohol dehydrogenase